MANNNNLKPFTKDNAKEMGRLGGIASGKSRRRKAYMKQYFNSFIKVQEYINSLSDIEFEKFISDYSVEQQNYIRDTFKPSKKKIREYLRYFKR